MRVGLWLVLILNLLTVPPNLSAQAPPESQFLVRLKYLKSDLPTRASTTCIAVFQDGRFHLEQREDLPQLRPQVYEDSLPESDLRFLRAIIDDPELKDLKAIETGEVVFRQGERGEVVGALISRGETTQRLVFNSQTGTRERSSKALPRPMEELVGWGEKTVKALDSRKVHPIKNAKPVMCWMAK